MKRVWRREERQLNRIRQLLKGRLVDRIRRAIQIARKVDGTGAWNAKQSLDHEVMVGKNLTRTFRTCRSNVGCQEQVYRDQAEWRLRLRGLLNALHRIIPPPLLNITQYMRRIPGLGSMADTSDVEYRLEEAQLQRAKILMEDCGTEECQLKWELKVESIKAERVHRLVLLERALDKHVSNFPERALFISILVILSLLVVGLLVLVLMLSGYWIRSKKKKPPKLRPVPDEEWEWRES